MTHVGVARPLIMLKAMEIRRTQPGEGVQAMANIHTYTHTHTLSLVI